MTKPLQTLIAKTGPGVNGPLHGSSKKVFLLSSFRSLIPYKVGQVRGSGTPGGATKVIISGLRLPPGATRPRWLTDRQTDKDRQADRQTDRR